MHLPVVLVILKVAQKGVAKFSGCQSMPWTAFLMLAALPSIWTEAGELLCQLSTTPLLSSASGARGGTHPRLSFPEAVPLRAELDSLASEVLG